MGWKENEKGRKKEHWGKVPSDCAAQRSARPSIIKQSEVDPSQWV